MWCLKTILTTAEVVQYRADVDKFRAAWEGLRWKPAVWVHWVCAHSTYFVQTNRTLFGFSSIPTERRHQRFKLDLRITCQAFKYRDPSRCKGYLKRCVELDALDQGLRLLKKQKVASLEPLFTPTHSGQKPKNV